MTSISLAQHIANENAKLAAAGFDAHIETDLSYWAESGITTAEQFIHNELTTEHYELYNDTYGIKPRWFKYNEMTIEELRFEIKDINDAIARRKQNDIDEQEAEKLRVQETKAKNAYKPNLAFANLKELVG